MKNLSLGLSKYVEQHTGVYERDIQRIGELFGKLHTALIPDVTTDGNQQLSSSIAQISASYRTIAELYKTKVRVEHHSPSLSLFDPFRRVTV